MLSEIKAELLKDGIPVFYGRVPEDEDIETWNYYVFNRQRMEKSGNVNYKQHFQVHLICEDFVPEERELELIKRITGIPGVHMADDPIEYDYILKGNTDMVVEMVTITFVKNLKGCI